MGEEVRMLMKRCILQSTPNGPAAADEISTIGNKQKADIDLALTVNEKH